MKINLLPLAILVLSLPDLIKAAAPVITHITKDVVANIGDEVEFNCTVENIGRMSVSWAKSSDGLGNTGSVALSMRNILSLNDPRYNLVYTKDDKTSSDTYTFKITKIEASDMGDYECQVIVSSTDKVTKKLNLSIKTPAVISEEHTPKSTLVTEGHNLEVTCHAGGFPKPIISWKRENDAIMPAGGQTYTGPTLRIKSAHRLDRGGYYCIAENGVGQPDKRLIRIEVEFRPQISVQKPKVAQMLSNPVNLECTVLGYPAPAVFWYRNGAKLQSDSQYQISNTASSSETTTSVLRILSVSSSDYGDYYCNATNKLGHADARLNLFKHDIQVPSLSS